MGISRFFDNLSQFFSILSSREQFCWRDVSEGFDKTDADGWFEQNFTLVRFAGFRLDSSRRPRSVHPAFRLECSYEQRT